MSSPSSQVGGLTRTRECITVAIGDGGLKIAEGFWRNLARDHRLDPTGMFTGNDDDHLERISSYFQEKLDGSYTPRCIFTDLSAATADGIWMRDLAGLLNPQGFVIGKDNGDSEIHSCAYHVTGPQISRKIMDQIRKSFESSDNAQVLAYQHNSSEASGGGLGTLLLQLGHDLIQNANQITYSVFIDPAQMENSIDGINSFLTTQALHEYSTASVLYGGKLLPSEIAESIAEITQCERLPGENSGSTGVSGASLIPFPRLHYLISSIPNKKKQTIIQYESDYGTDAGHHGCTFLYNTLKRGCRFSLAELDEGAKTLTSNVCVRSTELRLLQVQIACAYRQIMAQDRFVDWIPNNFQVSHCRVETLNKITKTSILENSTVAGQQMSHLQSLMRSIRSTKAYMHRYAKYGFQMSEFDEAEEAISSIVASYKDVLIDKSPPPPPEPAKGSGEDE